MWQKEPKSAVVQSLKDEAKEILRVRKENPALKNEISLEVVKVLEIIVNKGISGLEIEDVDTLKQSQSTFIKYLLQNHQNDFRGIQIASLDNTLRQNPFSN